MPKFNKSCVVFGEERTIFTYTTIIENRLARIGLIIIDLLFVFALIIAVSGSYAVKRPLTN